jgi:hypothetical protein
MIEVMLSYAEMTNKVGILQMSLLLRDAGEKLIEVATKWRDKNSIKDLAK